MNRGILFKDYFKIYKYINNNLSLKNFFIMFLIFLSYSFLFNDMSNLCQDFQIVHNYVID